MKKVLCIASIIAAMVLSFLGGYWLNKTQNAQEREEKCNTMISFAIDKLEHLEQEFQAEEMDALICNVYAAKGHTADAELSGALHNLWNALVFNREKITGNEANLIKALQDKNVQEINALAARIETEN